MSRFEPELKIFELGEPNVTIYRAAATTVRSNYDFCSIMKSWNDVVALKYHYHQTPVKLVRNPTKPRPTMEGVKVMEGVASIALLPNGSISGHFIHLPNSICYGLHGTELECERECSRGEDYRLVKLTVTDYVSKREKDIVVECRGHDAAKISTTDHAHGWQKDVVGMVEEKHGKAKVSISFECETLKADDAAEDHLRKFMPKLVGIDAVVNVGPMTISGLEFDADTEEERNLQNH